MASKKDSAKALKFLKTGFMSEENEKALQDIEAQLREIGKGAENIQDNEILKTYQKSQ
ncbi:hypothetical protein OAP56_03530 [Rickettsiaceae bacterium]|nr:hypothetical protein [Rickettsiaceae bacterium]